jgi:hypothetical protein
MTMMIARRANVFAAAKRGRNPLVSPFPLGFLEDSVEVRAIIVSCSSAVCCSGSER